MSQRLAVLPGDGIGPEVVAEARRILDRLAPDLDQVVGEAGFATFESTGSALPAETLELARSCDAVLFGAVSSPSHPVEGYRSPIVHLRRELDLYANLRPSVSAPVAGSLPDIDLLVVRENTEGLYSGRERLEDEGRTAIAERVITRRASERIARSAFEAAEDRATLRSRRSRLTIVHKANVLRVSDGLFRQCVLDVAGDFPDVEVEEQLVDSMLYRLFREPGRWDVIVAPNLYGDIISDAAAALVGGLGLAASANVGERHLLVEPVHGSAPDIAGQGRANPIATLRATALLLHRLGRVDAARTLERALEQVLERGPHTRDLGGQASTSEVGDAVLGILEVQRTS